MSRATKPDPRTRISSIALSTSERQLVDALAEHRNTSVSRFLRKIVFDYIDNLSDKELALIEPDFCSFTPEDFEADMNAQRELQTTR